jgi:hypothetical protein
MSAAKPSLQDIAAMPYPASLKAMREHYQPDWGKPLPEGATEKRNFEVTVRWEARVRGSDTVEVEAWSEAEAQVLAEEKVCEAVEAECFWDDIDIDEVSSTVAELPELLQ